MSITLDYGPANIGTREYILPSHFALDQQMDTGVVKNRGDFGSYRKFESQSTFAPGAP